jgi:putative heme-binding domain-containing protein
MPPFCWRAARGGVLLGFQPVLLPRFVSLGVVVVGALAAVPGFAAVDPRGDSFDARLLSAEESRTLFHLPPGFEIQLVAAEPVIQKPLNLAFDAAGRVWLTGSTLYPWPARRDAVGEPIATFDRNWGENPVAFRAAAAPPAPVEQGADTIRVLADFDPVTGRARRITTFADGLNIPIGLVPLPRENGARGDSVLVYSIPAIWRLTDTDGDGRADRREKLYDGFGFRDTHGMSSNYWLWLDGWVYGTHGYSNQSEVVDRAGRVVRVASGNTYRFRPDGSRFEVFANGQSNPFGLAFDARGDVFTADSHSKPVYLLVPGGYYEGIGKDHDGLGFAPPITTDDHGSSAIAGIAHYSATQFPPEFRGNLFNGNPVTRRINRDRLDWRGSSPTAARQPDFLTSDDPSFRPVQVKLGPDGALWVADFYNPVIGHYEVPLMHPARDRSHGRVWRIVWRGLDRSVPAPAMANLATLAPAALVSRLADADLVVRSLAVSELLARPDAATAVPALHAAAERLIAGTDADADETAALPLFLAADRLGAPDDAQLRRALTRPESDVALAALRTLATREQLPADAQAMFSAVVGRGDADAKGRPAAPGHAWRVIADVLRRQPQPWGAPLLLTMLARAPEADFELGYALRLALKSHAAAATAETLRSWANDDDAAAQLAVVCLAVKTPAAAEFLLTHLERTKFAAARAGDFARHAVAQLPADRLTAVQPLIRSLAGAPLTQRVALAEGLALVAADPARPLPPEVDGWMRRELIAAMGDPDLGPAYRAINAVKPLPLPEKAVPLRRIAVSGTYNDGTRVAALRALSPRAEGTEETLIEVLGSNASPTVRRVAADLLGTPHASEPARAALVAAFTGAYADIAMVVATGLARSDDGAKELMDLAATGRINASLLRQHYVALALEARPPAIRARAEGLTRNLPPEDARLDAVIAQRVALAPKFRPDATRGATLFMAQCAPCHRFRDAGGSLGPSLDGIGVRPLARIVEDILDPNRNVDPAFRLATVTLKSGDAKTGINLRSEGERVLLTDVTTNQALALAKADVAQTTISALSPMPAAFETAIPEKDFYDLIEYLRAPGSAAAERKASSL